MSGLFITFEGIEGCGKTTLMSRIAQILRQKGHDPILTREPGGTQVGIALRKVLLDPGEADIDSVTELLLFGADRAQHVSEVIRPALDAGLIVLCDRFSDATLAYQGYGRGIALQIISTVDEVSKGDVHPDMTVLLDLPVETGLGRVRTRNMTTGDRSESRIDEEQFAFHSAVREGYLLLAKEDPHRFLVLDARQNPQELAAAVMEEMAARFDHAL